MSFTIELLEAGAIEAAIQKLYPSAETVMMDPEEECRRIFGTIGHKLFIESIKKQTLFIFFALSLIGVSLLQHTWNKTFGFSYGVLPILFLIL